MLPTIRDQPEDWNAMNPTELRFVRFAREVLGQSQLWAEAQYIQHGVTSTLLHSLAVAYLAWCIARLLRL